LGKAVVGSFSEGAEARRDGARDPAAGESGAHGASFSKPCPVPAAIHGLKQIQQPSWRSASLLPRISRERHLHALRGGGAGEVLLTTFGHARMERSLGCNGTALGAAGAAASDVNFCEASLPVGLGPTGGAADTGLLLAASWCRLLAARPWSSQEAVLLAAGARMRWEAGWGGWTGGVVWGSGGGAGRRRAGWFSSILRRWFSSYQLLVC
jgi:hypothetical protein